MDLPPKPPLLPEVLFSYYLSLPFLLSLFPSLTLYITPPVIIKKFFYRFAPLQRTKIGVVYHYEGYPQQTASVHTHMKRR